VGIDEKARNAILHARVVGSFANPVLVQLREQLQQRDELLTQQDTTISRLLAFVPAKALAVSDERLQAIVAEVGEIAASVFKGHNIKWSLSDEDDPESLACHRFTVVVEMTDKDDLEELVVAEMKLREQLVSSMSDKELRALRILVEYETLARA
ncbi:MAG TPA: hypothetical protein VEK37_03465, partial [Gemmatimonadaceae bacterium]|nr:hypothetical protein [Gemmatimonadaceae bacterium]